MYDDSIKYIYWQIKLISISAECLSYGKIVKLSQQTLNPEKNKTSCLLTFVKNNIVLLSNNNFLQKLYNFKQKSSNCESYLV